VVIFRLRRNFWFFSGFFRLRRSFWFFFWFFLLYIYVNASFLKQ